MMDIVKLRKELMDLNNPAILAEVDRLVIKYCDQDARIDALTRMSNKNAQRVNVLTKELNDAQNAFKSQRRATHDAQANTRQLRAQLDAAYAALDVVANHAKHWTTGTESFKYGESLLAILLKMGVHPR
jgi:predicted choloylglycine hydrolase